MGEARATAATGEAARSGSTRAASPPDSQRDALDTADRRALYRERTQVERTVNRLKAHRRVATRYEKLAAHYQAMVTLAAILLWL